MGIGIPDRIERLGIQMAFSSNLPIVVTLPRVLVNGVFSPISPYLGNVCPLSFALYLQHCEKENICHQFLSIPCLSNSEHWSHSD